MEQQIHESFASNATRTRTKKKKKESFDNEFEETIAQSRGNKLQFKMFEPVILHEAQGIFSSAV